MHYLAEVCYSDGKTDYFPAPEASDLNGFLQDLVGGAITTLPWSDNQLLVINKEAQHSPRINLRMTRMAQFMGAIAASDYLVGTSVIIPRSALQ